jgi:hypothetical protein
MVSIAISDFRFWFFDLLMDFGFGLSITTPCTAGTLDQAAASPQSKIQNPNSKTKKRPETRGSLRALLSGLVSDARGAKTSLGPAG